MRPAATPDRRRYVRVSPLARARQTVKLAGELQWLKDLLARVKNLRRPPTA